MQRGPDPYRAATQVLEPQLVSQLAHRHGIGHVLLVGKHQQHRIPKLILLQLRREKKVEPMAARSPRFPADYTVGEFWFLTAKSFVGKTQCTVQFIVEHRTVINVQNP